MNLSAIKIIILNTLNNEWRSKAVIFLSVFTVFVLLIALAVLSFVNEHYLQEMQVESLGVRALGIFFLVINIWSYLISIYFGVSSVRTDAEYSVLPQILSFPISRGEYLTGRILGSLLLVMGYYFISLLLAIISISLVTKSLALSPFIFIGFIMNSIPNFMVILISLLVGPYMGKLMSFITMVFLTLFIVISNGRFASLALGQYGEDLGFFSIIGLILHTFFPHIAVWGGLGNSFITTNDFTFQMPLELSHFIISVAFISFLVHKRFKSLAI
ncbi:MAG: hypothetical protein CME63_05265 [Halobacteriovoraceae bacterium]|nr:hypothetical protein [Halobacteriovoraceae bacterium]|tara:strand:+ start:17921 stop:18736 length:816 start_codon:yes stop_codon:yes gene_type:complete